MLIKRITENPIIHNPIHDWQPPILAVETVESGDEVWIPRLRVFAHVIRIHPDPFARNEYEAEPTAHVTYYDPKVQSSCSDYLYEGECYVVSRELH